MAESNTVETRLNRQDSRGLLHGLLLFAKEPLGLLVLVWTALALGAVPLLMAAHRHGGGDAGEFLRTRLGPLALARLAGTFQWIAFVGLATIGAMLHARFAQKSATSEREHLIAGLAYAVGMPIAYVVFLWGPVSVFTLMMHDSFIFFDSTYRILQGQVPSRDFPTALGAVALYLPAAASGLIGGYAGSIELASSFFALICGLACAYAGATRLPIAVNVALIVAVFLVATPATLLDQWGSFSFTLIGGDTMAISDNLTWAMFYNRWAWAALLPVFIFLAPTQMARAPRVLEIAVLAGLLTLLFYLKLSYFVVAGAAAGLYAAVNPRPLRTLAIGGGLSVGLVLAVGLPLGLIGPYLRDVYLASQVSGGRAAGLVGLIRRNLSDILLALAPVAVLGVRGRLTWKDGVICAFMLMGSVLVLNQNAQMADIVTLLALAGYGVARVWAVETDRMARFAAMSAFCVLVAGQASAWSMTMMDQAVAARREETRAAPAWAALPALRGAYVVERESFLGLLAATQEPDRRQLLLPRIGALSRRQDLRQGEYLQVIQAGINELKPVLHAGDSVAALDMSNPFPALMNARAPRGAPISLQDERTISEDFHPRAEDIFADADHVMIPKISMLTSTADLMVSLYDPWLSDHYQERVESPFWIRYSRRKPLHA